jgi:membrane-associated phospholipid phosphatase
MATLFFGLAAVIFAEQRLVGLFCLVWVTVIIAIPRVILGFHCASDIIGSLLLGVGLRFRICQDSIPKAPV